MKKRILIVMLILVLCLSTFAACTDEGLEKARDYVKALYRDEAESTSTSYTRTTSVNVDGVSYSVDWTITNKDENAPKSAVVGEKADGMVTIDIDTYSTEKVEYVLTATISNEKGKTETVEFERFVPQFVINTYDEYIAACQANDGETVIKIKAYVIGVVNYESSSKGSLYLQDADGHGYYAYSPKDAAADCASTDDLRAKWPVGTEVIVSGTVTTYSGQYEYNKNCEIIKTGNTIESSQLGYVDATADFAAATSNEDTSLGKYQNARVTLKDATITRITIEYNTDGTFKRVYYYFTLPNSDVEFNVYYTIYFINETTMKALHDQLAVGKIVDLSGVVSVYSNDFQLYPDSENSVSNVRNAEYTDAEKVALAKENLTFESGTATTTEVELPATGELDTTITWAFKDGATYDFATIADGKLKVTALPGATTKITLVATITSGDASDTKEFTYTVSSAAIEFTSFADATTLAGTEKDVYTPDKYYLVGTIKSIANATYGNMTIEDTAGNTFSIYGSYDATGANRYDAMENAPQVGDVVVVYGVLGYYNAPQMKNGWIIASYSPKTFADATTLAGTEKDVYTPDKYYLVGTIKSIANATYGNMTIEDTAGNTFSIYGSYDANGVNRYDAMENAPQVGDFVVVYGVLGYYSAPQMKNGWIVLSYTPATSGEEGGEGGTDTPATVTTIADALAAAEGTTATFTGTVTEIYGAWSDEYNNMSVYVSDGTNKILVFRTTTKVAVGDTVSVSGTITIYYEKAQIAQGNTVTIVTAHVCTYDDATCTAPATCPVCGKTNGEALGHKDENSDGICDTCNANLATESSKVTETLAIAANTGTTGDKSISWTKGVATVLNEQGSSMSTIRTSDTDHFRAYKSSDLTISVSSGSISEIVVTCTSNDYATALVGSLTTTGATAVANGSTVTITVTGSISSVEFTMTAQTRFNSVAVTYIPAE